MIKGNERMDYARCLNPKLNITYIAVYTNDGKRALRTFVSAIKSLKPTRESYPKYYGQDKHDLRYTIRTIAGDMTFLFHGKDVRISAKENPALIESTIDLMNANEEFQWIGDKTDIVVEEKIVHHHCDFHYDKGDTQSHFYFDLAESFSQATFETVLQEIADMKILKRENLYSSWGPLESCDKITTSMGEITVSSIWEGMDTGYTISGNTPMMEVIVGYMRKSPYFSEA